MANNLYQKSVRSNQSPPWVITTGSGSSGITLASTLSVTGTTLGLYDTDNIKTYEVYESKEDLLALSVAWHRLRNTPFSPEGLVPEIGKLTDSLLFDQVIADDRTRATEIRNYYSKKIMMMLLKQRQLSVYREDLRTFINTNGQIFKKDMMPLVYKLPEFYDYDNLVDELFADLNKKIVDYDLHDRRKGLSVLKKITLSKLAMTSLSNRANGKKFEYWMKDADQYAYRITVPSHESLLQFWNHIFNSNSTFTIEGYFMVGKRDDLQFYNVTSWKVL